jgi:hypothetical protein
MKRFNSISQKFLALSLVFMFFVSVFTSFAQSKADFTGTWTLNEGKSQLGDGPGRRAATKMVITQDASSMTNERTSTRPDGETMVAKEKYNFDGSETDNTINNRKKKSTASWSADNQVFTVNSVTVFERDGNSMEMKSTEVYKLSADKQTLTIENTFNSPRGEMKTTLVYDISK